MNRTKKATFALSLVCGSISGGSLLAGTVAYWPMNEPVGGVVKDATANQYDLTVRTDATFADNDIGWTLAPNLDPASGEAWKSTKKLTSPSGSGKVAMLTSTSAELAAKFSAFSNFTVEGWIRLTELPSGKTSAVIMRNSLSRSYSGGWAWYLDPLADGSCTFRVNYYPVAGTGKNVDVLKVAISQDELTNQWNHIALVCTANNGSDKCVWDFYLNGVRRGSGTGNSCTGAFGSVAIYMSGIEGGSNDKLVGDLVGWRVMDEAYTDKKKMKSIFLNYPRNLYTWTGAKSAFWSLAETRVNWFRSTASDVSENYNAVWTDGHDVLFDDTGANDTTITVSGAVNPASITVNKDRDMTWSFGSGDNYIGPDCATFTKLGSGTLTLADADGNTGINKSTNAVHVKEGTLVANTASASGYFHALGDATAGYSAYVYDGATLKVQKLNSLGSGDEDVSNKSHLVVYAGGTLDLRAIKDSVATYQRIGTLELLGGTLILPVKAHISGVLQIRDKVAFGGSSAYVFEPKDVGSGDTMAWQIGTNTEFCVADITGDGDPDVTFNSHVLVAKAWQPEDGNRCGFRKTGAGTMRLAQAHDGYATSRLEYPLGTLAVEEGELRVDCDYSRDDSDGVAVAGGAFLSGTGTVYSVTFANGAGMRGASGQKDTLTVADSCSFGENGVIELTHVGAGAVDDIKVKLLTVDGTVTGRENLRGWTVKVNGEATKLSVTMFGKTLTVKRRRGLAVIIK